MTTEGDNNSHRRVQDEEKETAKLIGMS